MHQRKPVTIRTFLGALLLTGSALAMADKLVVTDHARLSISLTIAHPARIQVQSDLLCLHNLAKRTFSLRQTRDARAFDYEQSLPSGYHSLSAGQCKKGLALQLDAEPALGPDYALLHVLIEPE